jgi:hypothetical protein
MHLISATPSLPSIANPELSGPRGGGPAEGEMRMSLYGMSGGVQSGDSEIEIPGCTSVLSTRMSAAYASGEMTQDMLDFWSTSR